MKAQVVIGAGFGDEGKGLVTDYLCAPHGLKAVVVRFNGGAQAGHTVVTKDRRHVFSHLGSGSLVGAATYLSQFFVVNPLLWLKEVRELGCAPYCMVDPNAPVSTPYDMLINQEIETARGNARHGSCGIGINETLQRESLPVPTADLSRPKALEEKTLAIRDGALKRLAELDVEPSEAFLERLNSDELLRSFLQACAAFADQCPLISSDHLPDWPHVVFEGAQGLLLDQSHEFFPYVTHSNTGLKNVVELAGQGAEIEVFYVTRTYLTRHGAGPFPSELAGLKFDDATNEPNPWQGELRFGYLDVPLMADAITSDLSNLSTLTSRVCIAVTHCDQYEEDGIKTLSDRVGLEIGLRSYGPTREHIKDVRMETHRRLNAAGYRWWKYEDEKAFPDWRTP